MEHTFCGANKPPPLLASAKTPFFTFYEQAIVEATTSFRTLLPQSSTKLFYSLKANSVAAVIQSMGRLVDGFSVSSLFEAKLAREIAPDKPIHFVAPCIRMDECEEIRELCNKICCNTPQQMDLMATTKPALHSLGLRIDPAISFIDDIRYDPCGPHSKLGMHLSDSSAWLKSVTTPHLGGICFHNNSESECFDDLLETLKRITEVWPWESHPLRWINLGGGYLPNATGAAQLDSYLLALKENINIEEIILEPGFGLINSAGSLTSTVTDVFSKNGKVIAILDTTINHLPEVLEFELRPTLDPKHEGEFPCLLAGSSCLAGDMFGEYRVANIPRIGDQITFLRVGAYSISKANAFNGINLPDIYVINTDGSCYHCPKVGFDEYKKVWGRI